MVSPDLASKSVVSDFPVYASKPVSTVADFDLKITTMASCFWPQNQTGYGLSVVPQNRQEDEDDVGHASRPNGLLRVEVS
jgi:hypothetical protein